MAEGILRDLLAIPALAAARVSSAGIAAAPGIPASPHSVTVCAENGIDIAGHRSRPLSRPLIAESDLILTMEDHHRMAAERLDPARADRVHLLARYGAEHPEAVLTGVPDPIGGDLDDYRRAYERIHEQMTAALPRIERNILAGVES